MRYWSGVIWVLVLGHIGCSETSLDVCEGVECTDDVCDLTTGMCTNRPLEDGTDCGDGAGTCQAGSCTFARTEQGIRDAIALSGGPYEARTSQGDPTAKQEAAAE